MSDIEELKALRRLAELEDKASGKVFFAPAEKPALKWEAPPKSNSSMDYIINSVKKGVGNFAALPGMVLDLVRTSGGNQKLLDTLEAQGKIRPQGEIEKAGWGGLSQSGYDMMLDADRNMKAPNTMARLGGKAVEFAVSGGPFSVRTVANAPNIGRAIWAELGSAAGGGVGAEFGGDIGEALGSRATGELLGGVAGGITGLATPTIVDKGWSVVAPRISAAGREQAVQKIADKRLSGALNANLSTNQNLADTASTVTDLERLSGRRMQPTIGQATGAPAVIDIEHGVARGSPADLGRYAQRATENQGVVDAAKNAAFPAGGDFVRGASNTLRTATKALDDRLDKITNIQERLASNVRSSPQQAVGEQLQSLRNQAQNIARQVKTQMVDDLYATADRLGVSDSMDDVVAAVRSLGKSDEHIYQNMPPVFGKVIKEHGKDTSQLTGRSIDPELMAAAGIGVSKPASFKEIHSLWRETNSQLASAQRTGDNNSVYYLMTLKDALSQKLAKFEDQGFGELSAKFKDFNKWFSTKYAPTFYEGVGGRMNARGRFGEIVKPEDVVGKFFTPSGIDDFNMITSSLKDPESIAKANNALKDGVLGIFREKVIKDGVIDQTAAKNFIRANKETLDKIPDIKSALEVPTQLSSALADRAKRLAVAQREMDGTILARTAKSDNPDAVIQKALTSRKELMALVASARDSGSHKAILRGIADGIPKAAEKAGLDPLQFVIQNRDMLKPVLDRLGPDHFNNLRTIASGTTILNRTTTPVHAEVGKMMSAIEEATGSSPRTIYAQSSNATAGRQSPVSGVLHLLSRFGIKKAEERVTDVMREVIYNPELAAQLSAATNRPVTAAASNRLREHLINAGIRVDLANDTLSKEQQNQ